MVGAIVKNDIVQTLIVIRPEQVGEMQLALDAEIVDARPYGLAVGDLRTAAGWTRNVGGEQVVLQPVEEPTPEHDVLEALAILSGEVSEDE